MKNNDTQAFVGQLVAQNMRGPILTGQIVLSEPDRGAAAREAPVQGKRAIRSNSDMTEAEKFRAARALEGALDRIAAGARGG